MVAVNCPPDEARRAFHELLTVEPLSPTVTPQLVVRAVLVFLIVTFAQYPLPHSDCSASSADIVESALFSAESSESLCSSSRGSTVQASRQHAKEAEK
ncbi:hypothetical protein BE17_16295 [Sorangium cellulosum]|uniref:Uncharacterized protein n=1 Tax=Sorangium cellulosum TaxID=56 RepID=A0A150SUB9_SORCE|nr:hypothetical protein BE17_16295 [Sorangium cellulosum]